MQIYLISYITVKLRPAGIVHSRSQQVPEVKQFAVQLLDPLELIRAELCEAVGPAGTHLYHAHVTDPREDLLNLTKCLPQICTIDEVFLLNDL